MVLPIFPVEETIKYRKYLPKTWLQHYSALSVNILFVMYGLHLGWPTPSIPKLQDGSHVKVSGDEAMWISVLEILASIPAGFIAGFVLEHIGRKTIILALVIPQFITWMLIAFATNPAMLYIARFIAGFTDGFIFTAGPMYITEIADASVRGMLGSLPPIGAILGMVIINGIGQFLSIYTTALIASSFSILLLALFMWAPESPYYLITQCHYKEAKCNLRKLKGIEDIEEDFSRIANVIQADRQQKGRFTDLFTVASNRKALFLGFALKTVQQFSGVTAFLYYAPDILRTPYVVVIYFTVQLVMSCVSSFIVDNVGRRPLLMISTVGAGLACACIAIYLYLSEETQVDVSSLKVIPVITLIAYIILHSIGLTTIPMVMLGEIFPTSVKSFALGVADVYFCIVATAAVEYFHFVQKYIGMYLSFAGFAVFAFIGAIYFAINVPETKGKTLEEILKVFK